MNLSGVYYINCGLGTLIISSSGEHGGLWLRNNDGVNKLLDLKELEVFPVNNENSLQALLPFKHIVKRNQYAQFLFLVTERILKVVSLFPEDHKKLLQLCFSIGLPAVEIVEDCPALAFLIATYNEDNKPYTETSRLKKQEMLMKCSRKKALEYLGLPGTKSFAKLLRKIPASECSIKLMKNVEDILHSGESEKIQILRHLPTINRLSVLILSDDDLFPFFESSFFVEVSKQSDQSDCLQDSWQLFDYKNLLIDSKSRGIKIPPIKSFYDLENTHDQLIEWTMQNEFYEEVKDIVFSPPPLSDLIISEHGSKRQGIFSLSSGAALWHEGMKMNHCIAGYAQQIRDANGWLYAYHVALPIQVPATLLIEYLCGKWRILEIRGPHNNEVASTVIREVEKWLTDNREDNGDCL